MFNNTLGFHVYTTKYLGNDDFLKFAIKSLMNIPIKYLPTKAEVNSSKNKCLFSSNNINEMIERALSGTVFGGYLRLYKVKSIFEIYINWLKSPADIFTKQPYRKFNTISFYIKDGLSCISNENEFSILKSFWISLCEYTEAIYGNCLVYDSNSSSNDYLGWGYGRCIPRLHWQTYFGRKYSQIFNFRKNELLEKCIVEKLPSDSNILILDDNPQNLTLRSDLEREVISLLGQEYFWNEHDNRLKPKYDYLMPEIDISDLIYHDV